MKECVSCKYLNIIISSSTVCSLPVADYRRSVNMKECVSLNFFTLLSFQSALSLIQGKKVPMAMWECYDGLQCKDIALLAMAVVWRGLLVAGMSSVVDASGVQWAFNVVMDYSHLLGCRQYALPSSTFLPWQPSVWFSWSVACCGWSLEASFQSCSLWQCRDRCMV